jgi:arylsulfatase A-like enzyme
MFTGLLPGTHGAHFQNMDYACDTKTLAEVLAERGYRTEVVTRNSIFDGSIGGITRGFQTNVRIVAELSGLNPLTVALAISKPRFRRQITASGFFSKTQRQSLAFVREFSRATVPADRKLLEYVLDRMKYFRAAQQPYFLFANLYDVHAPYPPSPDSIFRPLRSTDGLLEAVTMPFVLPKLGGHRYLREGFRVSKLSTSLLLQRYHRAIELMDEKLSSFFSECIADELLENTLVIVTSDHGEAFGEHGLYLHDASVLETHLHVPLFVCHPHLDPSVIHDVVSTRELATLARTIALEGTTRDTILDEGFRAANPIALSEHYHYPHVRNALPAHRYDLASAVIGESKFVVRAGSVSAFDLRADPCELHPTSTTLREFAAACRRLRAPAKTVDEALAVLSRH